jgi:hypothetical protein
VSSLLEVGEILKGLISDGGFGKNGWEFRRSPILQVQVLANSSGVPVQKRKLPDFRLKVEPGPEDGCHC